MTQMNQSSYDIAVIGGGPAGMMAAATAGATGKRVILIEKNDSLGKKLLITGGGRCNVTNAEEDTRVFLSKFKGSGKFLHSTFSQWSVKETLDFFHTRGVATKVENEKRVFPLSNSATSIWEVMVHELKKHNVTILSHSPAIGFLMARDKKTIKGMQLKNKKEITAERFILATGGTSRPETGSTGDAYPWLSHVGHTIITPTPSLVPVSIKESWVKKVAGLSIRDISLSVLQNNVIQDKKLGKILFTHVGLSGPTILNMSRDIGELLKYGPVTISLDLFPKHATHLLDKIMQKHFTENNNKMFKNSLSGIVPASLAPIIVSLSKIDGDKQCNRISREERLSLVSLLKNITMTVKGLLDQRKAIITSGGVVLEEVDFKTMQSRKCPNLYIVGDLLNIDRPSGGYSLQLCFTTGFVAGSSAALK